MGFSIEYSCYTIININSMGNIFFNLHDNTSNSWCIVSNMAYKAFITYLACGATIPCSQKHKFSVLFFRYKAYIKLNREICNELLISCTSN